ncbi:MAG: TonB family protein [Prevotella sp.]|nr:TonB family protein [Prevotella sp.]
MNVYRRLFLTLAIWACTLLSFAQNEQVYDIVDTPPTYPGGKEELISYLEKNLKYPFLAAEEGIQGKVSVSFVVEKDGSVNDVKVIDGVHPLLDKEAIRVVSSMSNWTPGRKSNQIVRTRFIMPVSFKLDAPVVEQSAEIHKVWIEQNYDERNKCVLTVYADFTVYGMENYKGLIQMRIRNSKGEWVKMQYATETKDGAYYYESEFKPEYQGTTYHNHRWFSYWNEMLKLKNKKQYELILSIISTKNGKTLAESSPYSFTAFPRNDPAAKSTYTTRTYTPVQSPVYPTFHSSKKSSTQNHARTPNNNQTNNNTSYTSRNTNTSSSYKSRNSRATYSSRTSTSNQSDNSQGSDDKKTKTIERKKCFHCSGSGKVKCNTCRGDGRLKCGACKGTGYWTQRGVRHDCAACDRGFTRCNSCGGKGTRKCGSCYGKGYN